jgi:hypothetical protein
VCEPIENFLPLCHRPGCASHNATRFAVGLLCKEVFRSSALVALLRRVSSLDSLNTISLRSFSFVGTRGLLLFSFAFKKKIPTLDKYLRKYSGDMFMPLSKEKQKLWYQQNKASILEKAKQYRIDHADDIKEYRKLNKEKISESSKNYYLANKTSRKKYDKELYAKNRDQNIAKAKERLAIMKSKDPFYLLFMNRKSKAKKKGITFDVKYSDLVLPSHCPILGIPLFFDLNKAIDNTPSIDKIDPSMGYIKGNVQIISYKANRIKNNASLEELKLIGMWATKYIHDRNG